MGCGESQKMEIWIYEHLHYKEINNLILQLKEVQ